MIFTDIDNDRLYTN